MSGGSDQNGHGHGHGHGSGSSRICHSRGRGRSDLVAASFLLLLTACTGCPKKPAEAAHLAPVVIDAAVPDAAVADAAPPAAAERWLKGSTHVHALPSGDSREPIDDVIRWYRERGYDFIALTDHNRVSEVDGSTAGQRAVATDGLIVLSGVELTYNPAACDPPPPEADGKCRIHVNILGPTARPEGKIEWANRDSPRRLDSYQNALDRAKEWGGIVQINHPQWHWGMNAELLTELARRGAPLVEVANKQFTRWNDGDADHPSIEALWDAALVAGMTMWGVASDDAHDYDDLVTGRYPAGGAWVMVRAAPEPDAIVAALAAGRFYASTGVTLARADVESGALVVEVADEGDHVITFIGDGRVLAEHSGRSASQPLAGSSYVRAVVRRADGARAWVQPARP